MTASGHTRGHRIEYDEAAGEWRYADTGAAADQERPCALCQQMPTAEGYDACLGELPGVRSACCGHGVEDGYIMNSEIIATIQNGFHVEKRSSLHDIKFDARMVAIASAAFAAVVDHHISSILFHGSEQAAREENATQQLMYHWKMTREELDGRLQQIADANPGDWSDKSAHRVWVYVMAGVTFDADGKLGRESLPFLKPYEPRFEWKSRFDLKVKALPTPAVPPDKKG